MALRQTIANGLRRLANAVDGRPMRSDHDVVWPNEGEHSNYAPPSRRDKDPIARERRVRNIVREINAETRRSNKGQN